MSLRDLSSTMEPASVARIDTLLDRVVAEHGVSLPLAIEAGSRAWGFPSPDSDYDCRFIFVRPIAQHLTPWPPRDVIEFPLEGDLDVNGWDFGKALRLMLKGNPSVVEWLSSPLVYRGEAWFRDGFLDLAMRTANRDAVGRHYLRFGERQQRSYLAEEAGAPLKRIFYAVQPAASLRWLRQHPEASVAPMHLPTLLAECAPPAEVHDLLAALIERKARGRRLGEGPLPAVIAAFMETEFALAETAFHEGRVHHDDGVVETANAFYRTVVETLDRRAGGQA